ncbi:MAG: DUF1499 domain-containing protein [Hyphomicrobiales bacterium]|nr:DUF1499 domain-containing protein [Hyphomicrobiales bacterium]
MAVLKAVAALVLALLAVAGVLRLTPLWDRLLSPGDLRKVDFATLELASTPNQFLMCPPDLCRAATPHAESPVFDRPAADLRRALETVALATPGVEKVAEEGDTLYLVARTPLMRWPDWITLRVIDLGDRRSTLAAYGRAVYGRRDFGANRARIEGWFADLP